MPIQLTIQNSGLMQIFFQNTTIFESAVGQSNRSFFCGVLLEGQLLGGLLSLYGFSVQWVYTVIGGMRWRRQTSDCPSERRHRRQVVLSSAVGSISVGWFGCVFVLGISVRFMFGQCFRKLHEPLHQGLKAPFSRQLVVPGTRLRPGSVSLVLARLVVQLVNRLCSFIVFWLCLYSYSCAVQFIFSFLLLVLFFVTLVKILKISIIFNILPKKKKHYSNLRIVAVC